MANSLKPQLLKSGDVVGVISPSAPVSSKRDLSRGLRVLESLGFKPKLGPKALEVRGGYQAGSRIDRLHDLHAMFLDDEVRGIFCAGGGYASIQLLSDINFDAIKSNPKVFVGYSDTTTLLTTISEKTGLVTFHGPHIQGLQDDTKGGSFTVKHLKKMLMKGATGNLKGFTEWKSLKSGRTEGTLIGGNLNVLTSLLGTPFEPKWDGKILFWEEANETIEGIDNYLWRLRIAKVFKKIEGMIVGKISGLIDMEDERPQWDSLEKPPVLEDVILHATDGFNFPILYGADIGHDVPNITVPVGAEALLDCPSPQRTGTLSIREEYWTK